MVTQTNFCMYLFVCVFLACFKVAFEVIINWLQLMLVQYIKKNWFIILLLLFQKRQHVRRLCRSFCVTINSECSPANYFDFYVTVQYNLFSSPFKLCWITVMSLKYYFTAFSASYFCPLIFWPYELQRSLRCICSQYWNQSLILKDLHNICSPVSLLEFLKRTNIQNPVTENSWCIEFAWPTYCFTTYLLVTDSL